MPLQYQCNVPVGILKNVQLYLKVHRDLGTARLCPVINILGLCIKKKTEKGSKGRNNGFPHHKEQLLPCCQAGIMTSEKT